MESFSSISIIFNAHYYTGVTISFGPIKRIKSLTLFSRKQKNCDLAIKYFNYFIRNIEARKYRSYFYHGDMVDTLEFQIHVEKYSKTPCDIFYAKEAAEFLF